MKFFTFTPNPKYMSYMIEDQYAAGVNDVSTIPVLAWLIENVGELDELQSWMQPKGKGWRCVCDISRDHYPYHLSHRIVITRPVTGKLLTEFVLRFS